jgi:peptide/nickel transport system substrate-binding protein
MKLRQDLTWSDGTPLTSKDFFFTYQMFISSNNQVASREPYILLESLETPDDYTVVMTFGAPYAPWRAVSWHGLLPFHILDPIFKAEGTIDNAEWNLQPTVGCGPFVFAEWTPGSQVRFTANPNYWLGQPTIDEIVIRFVADTEQVSALTSGTGDMGTFFAFSDIPALEAAGLTVNKVFSGFNEGLSFYLNPVYGHPALQDIRVRQAIAMAIDTQTLLNELFGGQAQAAISYWDNTPYLDPNLTPWPYDPARAAALLDEAGWMDSNNDGLRDREGVDLSLTYGTTTREIRQKAQAIIREQLLQVGIRLDLIDYPPSLFFSGFAEAGPAATGQLDVYQLSSAIRFPDPDTADFLCDQLASMQNPSGVNWIAFCNQELNDLLVKQISQVGSPDTERQQTFHQISKIVFERAYFIGLWQDPDVWALNKRLLNVRLSGVTPFFNAFEWDVSD